ncbi:MAG: hypothetical protein ACFCUI_03615 [Bernardetiaceae bacterium]
MQRLTRWIAILIVWPWMLSTTQAQDLPVIGRIAINDGAASTSAPDGMVNLRIFARNAAEMRISNNGSWIGARWEPYAQTKRWRIDTREDGIKVVYAQFRNKENTILSDVTNAQIELDRTPPEDPSITINFGAEFTTDRKVTLELSVDEAKEMQISNRSDFLQARWYPFRDMVKNWLIGGLDGQHTVYVRFKDHAGNISEVASASINLDRQPPTVSRLRINNDSTYTRFQEVRLQVAAREASEMEIRNVEPDGTFGESSGWVPYDEDYVHTLSPGNGKKVVAVRFKDQTGNETRPVTASIIFDNIPPSATRIRINKGNRYTNRNEVNLQFAAVKASKMMVSNQPDFRDADWMPYKPFLSVWLLDRSSQGKKTVYAKFMDLAGNISDPVSDDIIFDDSPPKNTSIQIVTKEGRTMSGGRKVTNHPGGLVDLKLKADDVRYMMLSNTSTFFDARWDIFRETYQDWKLDPGQDGERTVYVKFRDKAGNVTNLQYDKVIYDREPPLDGRLAVKDYDVRYVNSDTTSLRIFARGADQMKIVNNDTSRFSEAKWEPYQQVRRGWILDPTEGQQRVFIKFRDMAGNLSQVYSGDIYMDKTPPQECTVQVNRGDTITNEPNKVVYVEARAKGAADMRIATDPSFRAAPWRYYDPKISAFPLPGDDGLKKIYAQFRDSAGNVSQIVQTQIILDRTPPIIGKVTINDGDKGTRFQKVTINLEAKGAVDMKVSNDMILRDAEWEPYQTNKEWTLVGQDGIKTVYVQFRDQVGNISNIAYARIGKDTQAPRDGDLVINDKAAKYVTNINKYVRLYIRVKDATVMKIANSRDQLDSAKWQPYQYIVDNWILGGEDGEKEVWVMFQDDVGNRTAPISRKIILDRQAPYDEEIFINGGEEYTNKREVRLRLNAEEASQMRISDSPKFPIPAKWEPYTTTKDWVLIGREGLKRVYVQFRDEAGNESYSTAASIFLDMTPPSPGFIKIGNGQPIISKSEVRLTFNARDADYMMVSNDASFTGATWQEYKTTIENWPLPHGSGYRRVYAKFKDKYQNESPPIFAEVTVE